jgi:hypothetical protein
MDRFHQTQVPAQTAPASGGAGSGASRRDHLKELLMILKNADSRERDREELERLIKIAPADRKAKGYGDYQA